MSDLWIFDIPLELDQGGNVVDLTLFAGPDPECTTCAEGGGCAFFNRSLFLEYDITDKVDSIPALPPVHLPDPGTVLLVNVNLTGGEYYDVNGDGYLDRVVLHFDSSIDTSMLNLNVRWEEQGFASDILKFTLLDSNSLSFELEDLPHLQIPQVTSCMINVQGGHSKITLLDLVTLSLITT